MLVHKVHLIKKKTLESLQQEGTKDILDWASVRVVSQIERREVCVTCLPTPHSQSTVYNND